MIKLSKRCKLMNLEMCPLMPKKIIIKKKIATFSLNYLGVKFIIKKPCNNFIVWNYIKQNGY